MAPFHKQCVARGCDAEPHYGMKRGEETRWACGPHRGLIGFATGEAPSSGADAPPSPARGEGKVARDLFAAAG
jgi:hypothetical protein